MRSSSQKSRSQGLRAPSPGLLCRGAGPCSGSGTMSSRLASVCTLPVMGRSFLQATRKHCWKERHSLHAGEVVWPLGSLWGGRGRRARVRASDPFPTHTDPQPIRAHPRPGTPGKRPGSLAAGCASEPLAISPSSSPHHCACAARAPAEPLHGSLFDSSHPGPPARSPQVRAGRSTRG